MIMKAESLKNGSNVVNGKGAFFQIQLHILCQK